MKKVLTVITILVFVGTAGYSQNIGLFIGGGFSDMRMRTDSIEFDKEMNKDELKFRKIYHAGINFENDLIERQLYLQLGIHAKLSGFSSHEDSIGMYFHNIHIPIELKYKYFFDKRGESYIYASGGPYFSLAYKGIQYDKEAADNFVEDEYGYAEMYNPVLKLGKSENDDIEPFDFGINLGAGFGYSYLQIGYNFGLGLSNIIPSEILESDEKFKMMNSYHTLTVGFYFTNN